MNLSEFLELRRRLRNQHVLVEQSPERLRPLLLLLHPHVVVHIYVLFAPQNCRLRLFGLLDLLLWLHPDVDQVLLNQGLLVGELIVRVADDLIKDIILFFDFVAENLDFLPVLVQGFVEGGFFEFVLLEFFHDDIEVVLDVSADGFHFVDVFAEVVVFDVGNLGVPLAFLDEIVEVVFLHVFDGFDEFVVEVFGEDDLLVVVVVDLGKFFHIFFVFLLDFI